MIDEYLLTHSFMWGVQVFLNCLYTCKTESEGIDIS